MLETVATLAVTIITALLTVAAEWLRRRTKHRDAYYRLVEIIDLATMDAWESFGREFLKASEDGKITADERKHLQQHALELVEKMGKEAGVDAAKVMGPELVSLMARRYLDSKRERDIHLHK